MKAYLAVIAALVAVVTPAAAQDKFTNGPVIKNFGAVAKVDTDLPLPPGMDYKILFDVKTATPGERSTGIDAAARTMNMLAASGVPVSKIHPAIVIHSKGLWDVTTDARYRKEAGGPNPNIELVRELVAQGVPIYVCGQTLARYDVDKSELLPGVKVALSAINAHAILQRQGYTLNPF